MNNILWFETLPEHVNTHAMYFVELSTGEIYTASGFDMYWHNEQLYWSDTIGYGYKVVMVGVTK